MYIVGTIGGLQLANPVRINTGSLADLMYSIYMSHDEDRVYLVISSGEIFNSVVRDGQLQLEPHNVISENIRKVCTGAGFVAIVTESNRLLTTFREKTSASSVNHSGRLRSPRELRKFATLMVVTRFAASTTFWCMACWHHRWRGRTQCCRRAATTRSRQQWTRQHRKCR